MKRALFVVLAACGTFESNIPVATTSASVPARPVEVEAATLAPIQAMVRLATSGVVELRSDKDPAVFARAVHVRTTLHNETLEPWLFDVSQQRIVLAGRESAAAFSSATAGNEPPLLTIPAGTSRVVDLFYTLPPDRQLAAEIPPYDVVAWIDTGDQVVVERMPYAKLEPTTLDVGAPHAGGFASGPAYEYDLFHESAAFPGTVELSRRLVGWPLTVAETAVQVAR